MPGSVVDAPKKHSPDPAVLLMDADNREHTETRRVVSTPPGVRDAASPAAAGTALRGIGLCSALSGGEPWAGGGRERGEKER